MVNRTLSVPVPDGRYDVTVHAGDMLPAYSHEKMVVTIEGTRYNLPDTVGGQVIATTCPDITVSDGQLTLLFQDWGGPNPYVTLAGLEIVEDVPTGPPLALSIAADSMDEDGTTTATLTREGTAGELVVDLSSDKPDEAMVPGQVTIPDGQTSSAAFTITGLPDGAIGSDETVTITGSAPGFTSGSDTLVVTNIDEPAFFEVHYEPWLFLHDRTGFRKYIPFESEVAARC